VVRTLEQLRCVPENEQVPVTGFEISVTRGPSAPTRLVCLPQRSIAAVFSFARKPQR
jgi:hypothetical protein